MTQEHILVFGRIPQKYLDQWDITSDLSLRKHQFDVQFVEIPTETLITKMQQLTNHEREIAQRMTQQLITHASPNLQQSSIEGNRIVEAVELYVAMSHYVDKYHASAVTIVCRPWIQNAKITTPCIALMLFQEAGVPAACQGDLDALLTMVLFKRVAGVMSVMGNNFAVDGQLGIGHCVVSRRFCGTNHVFNPYYIGDYHGRQPSPTIHPKPSTNQVVTIARFTHNLTRLILASGVLVGNRDLPERCRNTLIIQVADTKQVLNTMKGLQQHLVVACGDHRKALIEYAQSQDIAIVMGE